MALGDFDKVAGIYDFLAKLVFDERLQRAQTGNLGVISPGSSVLLLGGGTGKIVEEILAVQPDCHITFVDASSAMITIARKRNSKCQNINYVHGTEQTIPGTVTYDVVITAFYLDMFPADRLPEVIGCIERSLKHSAVWLATDFYNAETLWERWLLTVMYSFFRFTAKISAKGLPDWKQALTECGWYEQRSERDGFIESVVYEKSCPVS